MWPEQSSKGSIKRKIHTFSILTYKLAKMLSTKISLQQFSKHFLHIFLPVTLFVMIDSKNGHLIIPNLILLVVFKTTCVSSFTPFHGCSGMGLAYNTILEL